MKTRIDGRPVTCPHSWTADGLRVSPPGAVPFTVPLPADLRRRDARTAAYREAGDILRGLHSRRAVTP